MSSAAALRRVPSLAKLPPALRRVRPRPAVSLRALASLPFRVGATARYACSHDAPWVNSGRVSADRAGITPAPAQQRWRRHGQGAPTSSGGLAGVAALVAGVGVASMSTSTASCEPDGSGSDAMSGVARSPAGANGSQHHAAPLVIPSPGFDTVHDDRLQKLAERSSHGHRQVFDSLASATKDGVPMMTFKGAPCARAACESACADPLMPLALFTDFLRSRLYHHYDFHGDVCDAALARFPCAC